MRGVAHVLFQLFAVSMIVMGVAQTLTKERIFAPLRDRLGGKDTWFGYLCSCPYCASHWIAFVVVPITGTFVVDVPWQWGVLSSILRWFLSSILVATTSAFFRIVFMFVDESQGLLRRREKEEDLALAREGQRADAGGVLPGGTSPAEPRARH